MFGGGVGLVSECCGVGMTKSLDKQSSNQINKLNYDLGRSEASPAVKSTGSRKAGKCTDRQRRKMLASRNDQRENKKK